MTIVVFMIIISWMNIIPWKVVTSHLAQTHFHDLDRIHNRYSWQIGHDSTMYERAAVDDPSLFALG